MTREPDHIRQAREAARRKKGNHNGKPSAPQQAGLNAPHPPGDAYEGPIGQDSVFGFPPVKDSRKPNPKTDSTFLNPVVASKLKANAGLLHWLWHGFIADKAITLFSALWKAGKTTLLAHLIRNMADGTALCGYEVAPATVLYITEESESRWAKRRDTLGIGDNVHFLCRPFKAKPSVAKWHEFVAYVREQGAALGAQLIVLDTLAAFWPVQNENDASEVQAALMPLWTLAEHFGVLAVHHLRKGDGQEATGSRGSGAITGFVDTIMELRRHDPSSQHSRKRVIKGYGRDDETPAELVIELDAETHEYRGLGDRMSMRREEIKRTVLSLLPAAPPGLTHEEITEVWPNEEKPTKSAMLEVLRAGTGQSWTRYGTGRRGNPYRYSKLGDQAT